MMGWETARLCCLSPDNVINIIQSKATETYVNFVNKFLIVLMASWWHYIAEIKLNVTLKYNNQPKPAVKSL